MANETVFLVICVDRHTDDVITVHRTREGADAEIEEFKASYDVSPDEWTERVPSRRGSRIRYVSAGDDGPSATIRTCEVKP